VVDPDLWRRWRLILACAGLLAVGLLVYAYIPIRAVMDPEPPLFYARPDTFERFRYLVFAEQFHGLFAAFQDPVANLGAKWAAAEAVLADQFIGPGWLLAAVGAAILAARQPGTLGFLAMVVAVSLVYAMNFNDGDIARYHMTTTFVGALLIGIAVSAIAAAAARAMAEARRRAADPGVRRRLATITGAAVLAAAATLPLLSVTTLYAARDQSRTREAERWVASVHEALPERAVLLSWWSYSTPLWYHRWVLGERPDITIIDERNILDDGYGTIHAAISTYLGRRPVYVIPAPWERERIRAAWVAVPVATYAGYTDLLRIEEAR
jgi:hypothetical protein